MPQSLPCARQHRLTAVSLACFVGALQPASLSSASIDHFFDDPLFKRCISWMLLGEGGALIENLCIDDYAIPPPSLFLCARKVMIGFESVGEQEGCAVVFEEQVRKIRSGYVK